MTDLPPPVVTPPVKEEKKPVEPLKPIKNVYIKKEAKEEPYGKFTFEERMLMALEDICTDETYNNVRKEIDEYKKMLNQEHKVDDNLERNEWDNESAEEQLTNYATEHCRPRWSSDDTSDDIPPEQFMKEYTRKNYQRSDVFRSEKTNYEILYD